MKIGKKRDDEGPKMMPVDVSAAGDGSSTLKIDLPAAAAGVLHIPASMASGGHVSVSPHTHTTPSYVPVPGPPGPPGMTGPMGPPGIATTGTSPTLYMGEEEALEKAEREAELVTLPPRRPKKVLVAFIDEDSDEATEPFWAAYLEPDDMDMFLSPQDSRDAHMVLRLKLRKRFTQ